jgi:hypothetical protein
VGQSATTTSTSAAEMSGEPVKYEELPEEHKKKYTTRNVLTCDIFSMTLGKIVKNL